MSCPGGSCNSPERLESKLLLYGTLSAAILIGCLWVEGWRKTAYALGATPVVLWLFGRQLSWALDQTIGRLRLAWRTHARASGRRYCPECHCALAASAARPVLGESCPRCDGAWVPAKDLTSWLAPYGSSQATWLAAERDRLAEPMLCPSCAKPLDLGTIERVQPVFGRCEPCGSQWVDRMAWVWFDLTPPKAPAPRPAPRPDSVAASRKD